MKRWRIIDSDGTELLLYYPTQQEAKENWENAISITETTDDYHSKYCDKIVALAKKVLYDYKNRKIYMLDTISGFAYVRLYKDEIDNKWYDYCEFQLHNDSDLVIPITFTTSNPKEFYNEYCIDTDIKYSLIQFAKYGEKLTKPKELKGIKEIGSVDFIPKKCKCQVFIKDNDVYIKHTDYFSPTYEKPEDIGTPLNYRLKKYGIKPKSQKFIYDDCWGAIVLRQQAWIKIDNLVSLIKVVRERATEYIVKEQTAYHKFNELDLEWNRFYERICKLVLDKNEVMC